MGQVEERNLVAMDLTAMMAVCQIADDTGRDAADVLPDFLASYTAALLYDDSYKLWWDGPDEVAEMYVAESRRAEVDGGVR